MTDRSGRRGKRGMMVIGSVGTALVVLAALAVRVTADDDRDGDAWPPAPGSVATVAPTASGPRRPPPPRRALIFGDSIAVQHGAAAAIALREAGVEAEVFGLWGGSLFTRAQYDMGATNPRPPAGTLMAEASARVADLDPDVVAVYVNHNYWPPYPRDAAGEELTRGSEGFAAMARTQLGELVHRLRAGGAQVYLVEPVPEAPGLTTADNAIWSAYLSVHHDLGVDVIHSGAVLAGADGAWRRRQPDCRGVPTDVHPPGDPLHLTYFGAGLLGTATARGLADGLGRPAAPVAAPAQRPAAMLPLGAGYRLVTCDGAVFTRVPDADADADVATVALVADQGDADPVGAEGGMPGTPVVDAAPAAGDGAWLLGATGHVAERRDAPDLGDADVAPGDTAVALAATPSGDGYWVATSGGTVRAHGDAEELGDLAGMGEPVAALAASPRGAGYWLVTETGRVVGFGNARDVAGPTSPPVAPVVDVAAHPDGGGYWLLDAAGNVHPAGRARDLGGVSDQAMARVVGVHGAEDVDVAPVPPGETAAEAVALLPTPSGDGYRVWLANGTVCDVGDARSLGGIHRGEVDPVMIFHGQPYYGSGPCIHEHAYGPAR